MFSRCRDVVLRKWTGIAWRITVDLLFCAVGITGGIAGGTLV